MPPFMDVHNKPWRVRQPRMWPPPHGGCQGSGRLQRALTASHEVGRSAESAPSLPVKRASLRSLMVDDSDRTSSILERLSSHSGRA